MTSTELGKRTEIHRAVLKYQLDHALKGALGELVVAVWNAAIAHAQDTVLDGESARYQSTLLEEEKVK